MCSIFLCHRVLSYKYSDSNFDGLDLQRYSRLNVHCISISFEFDYFYKWFRQMDWFFFLALLSFYDLF